MVLCLDLQMALQYLLTKSAMSNVWDAFLWRSHTYQYKEKRIFTCFLFNKASFRALCVVSIDRTL